MRRNKIRERESKDTETMEVVMKAIQTTEEEIVRAGTVVMKWRPPKPSTTPQALPLRKPHTKTVCLQMNLRGWNL
jgi:hypothetical protein